MTPRSHAVCTGALGAIQLSYSPLETHSPWSCRCSAEPTWHHHLSPTPTFAQRFVLPRSGIPAEAAPSYKLHDLLQHELLQQAEAASLQDTTWRRAGFCFKRSHVVSCLLMLRLKLCTNSFLGALEPPWVAHRSDSDHFCSCRAKACLPVRRGVAVPLFRLYSTPSALYCLYKPGRHLL